MTHFWLTYRDSNCLIGVAIVKAPSLIQARVNASVRGVDADAPFAEGHKLGAELIAAVPSSQTGRLLSGGEAAMPLGRLESRKPSRAPPKASSF
jgi:hypothetical protein